jgi:hypothetical protein
MQSHDAFSNFQNVPCKIASGIGDRRRNARIEKIASFQLNLEPRYRKFGLPESRF